MRLLIPILTLVSILGCKTVERHGEYAAPVRSTGGYSGDVPNMLKGTIKQHVALMGYDETYSDTYEPLIARGYGLVVDLDGTGSSEMPPQVRAHMLADLAKRGIGQSTKGWGNLTPSELLDSKNTAVVVIEAIIPQASTGRKTSRGNYDSNHKSLRGTIIDVHVFAEPSSTTASLEGGFLLPSSLRLGQLTTGKSQARDVATASGSLFINPFAEPDAINKDYIKRTAGRILEGGEVLHNMPMRLILIEPSHARASLIQTAINRVFPEEFGQDGPTARGMNDEQIEIRVPPSWKDDVPTFMNLLTHITLRSQNPESVALSVKRLILADPSPKNADAATWRWQSIGERSLPVIRELYDHPDELPRTAALRAGGGLKDAVAVPYLIEMAIAPVGLGTKLDALRMLKDMPSDYRIETGLRPLLDSDDVEIRLQAAETLAYRNDPIVRNFLVNKKFELLLVPSIHEMVYVTQTGLPQIILMGDVEIKLPLTLSTWDNHLLIRESQDNSELVEVRFRDETRRQLVHEEVSPDLASFTMFLAHRPTPENAVPGLDLSYSRTIGALHALWRQEYLNSDFKVEQDRLLAAIQRLANETTYVERPDFMPEEIQEKAVSELEIDPRFMQEGLPERSSE